LSGEKPHQLGPRFGGQLYRHAPNHRRKASTNKRSNHQSDRGSSHRCPRRGEDRPSQRMLFHHRRVDKRLVRIQNMFLEQPRRTSRSSRRKAPKWASNSRTRRKRPPHHGGCRRR
jgi:hypothetical protein